MPLLVTPDKKRKTESICESSGIKLRSSQELHVNQTLSVCVSAHDPASVHAFVCVCVRVCVRVCVCLGDQCSLVAPHPGESQPDAVVTRT